MPMLSRRLKDQAKVQVPQTPQTPAEASLAAAVPCPVMESVSPTPNAGEAGDPFKPHQGSIALSSGGHHNPVQNCAPGFFAARTPAVLSPSPLVQRDIRKKARVSQLQSQTPSKTGPTAKPARARKSNQRTTEKVNQPDIPLICHICEGSPTFSDASHLLTHCSSRAHTKRYLDLKARSLSNDGSAQQSLGVYDAWYDKHCVGALLGKRLQEKDQKDQEKKAEAERRRLEAIQAVSETGRKRKAASIDAKVKLEPLDDSPFTMSGTSTLGGTSQFKRTKSTYAYGGAASSSRASTGLDDDFSPSDDDHELEEDDDDNKRPQLKGVWWPGMDIFDSATEEGKKKRNQRKDASVVNKMRLCSEAVRSIETVSNLDLDFQRARDVYDSPSGDEFTPKKKTQKTVKQRSARKLKAITKPVARSASKNRGVAKTPRKEARKAKLAKAVTPTTAQVEDKRATRGSAARAQTKIAEQAKLESESVIEDEQAFIDDGRVDLMADAEALDEAYEHDPNNDPPKDSIALDEDSDDDQDDQNMDGIDDGHGEDDASVVNEPDMIQPDMIQPDMIQPDMIQPDMNEPNMDRDGLRSAEEFDVSPEMDLMNQPAPMPFQNMRYIWTSATDPPGYNPSSVGAMYADSILAAQGMSNQQENNNMLHNQMPYRNSFQNNMFSGNMMPLMPQPQPQQWPAFSRNNNQNQNMEADAMDNAIFPDRLFNLPVYYFPQEGEPLDPLAFPQPR